MLDVAVFVPLVVEALVVAVLVVRPPVVVVVLVLVELVESSLVELSVASPVVELVSPPPPSVVAVLSVVVELAPPALSPVVSLEPSDPLPPLPLLVSAPELDELVLVVFTAAVFTAAVFTAAVFAAAVFAAAVLMVVVLPGPVATATVIVPVVAVESFDALLTRSSPIGLSSSTAVAQLASVNANEVPSTTQFVTFMQSPENTQRQSHQSFYKLTRGLDTVPGTPSSGRI